MQRYLINNEMYIQIPDGYVINKKRYSRLENEFSIKNNNDYSSITITWIEFRTKIDQDLIDTMIDGAKEYSTMMNHSFIHNKNIELNIDNKQLFGFEYSYKSVIHKQIGQYLVCCHNGILYSFIFLSRLGEFESNYKTFKEVLKSIRFKH